MHLHEFPKSADSIAAANREAALRHGFQHKEGSAAGASAEFAPRRCLDAKPLTGFSIAGDDGRFVAAKAVIEGDKVLVSSLLIEGPGAVRCAWNETARTNLVNQAGLPSVPFRTQ